MSEQPIRVSLVADDEPADPDWDHVPEPLRRAVAEGRRLYVTDPETGERTAYAPQPGEWGAIARARDRDDWAA